MKQSIKKTFQNLNTYLIFVLLTTALALLLIFEHSLSYDKVDNLKHQKQIISSLTHLNTTDMELALIQFNAKSTQLHQLISELHLIYQYSYFERYLLHNKQEYFHDLKELSQLTDTFNQAAKAYYVDGQDEEAKKQTKEQLQNAFTTINRKIDTILLKNINYNERKFHYIKYIVYVLFILILLATLYYRRALNTIYKDIHFLSQINNYKKNYHISTLEADAIALRMNRKNLPEENPDFIDPVTNINNLKGLLFLNAQKKSTKEYSFTSVTVLEIDNFSKSNRPFSQEVTQAILKKIAYTISLHQQPVDIIARTGYNQFTIIFSRSSKEQAYKDIEILRESISELRFNIPHKGTVQITVSGGFLIKPNNASLEEAMKQAKEIMHYAQSIGKNKILQTRDLAHRDI
jgi:diguanylate cyclase (GGDEF)-like protein